MNNKVIKDAIYKVDSIISRQHEYNYGSYDKYGLNGYPADSLYNKTIAYVDAYTPINEPADSYSLYNKTYFERIIFGTGIGKGSNCLFHTPAEAFVNRLYSYEVDISHADTEQEKIKINEEKQNFLKTFHEELTEDEPVIGLLHEASDYNQEKLNFYANKPGKIDEFSATIVGSHKNISGEIEDLLSKFSTPTEDFGLSQ